MDSSRKKFVFAVVFCIQDLLVKNYWNLSITNEAWKMKLRIMLIVVLTAFSFPRLCSAVIIPIGINGGGGSLGAHFGAEISVCTLDVGFLADQGVGMYSDYVAGNGTKRLSAGPELVLGNHERDGLIMCILDGGYTLASVNGKRFSGITARTTFLFKSGFLICPVLPYLRVSQLFGGKSYFETGALVKFPIEITD
jgi:hypothetical protein